MRGRMWGYGGAGCTDPETRLRWECAPRIEEFVRTVMCVIALVASLHVCAHLRVPCIPGRGCE